MKPITEYQNYREYMRDFYEERKRSSLFSWREFSKLAGFASPNFMQLVCEGKSRLSKTGVEKWPMPWGLRALTATISLRWSVLVMPGVIR